MSRSLFVSGLSPRTTFFVRVPLNVVRIDDLEPFFREYGRLKDVYIPRDFYTREPRGFAYIEYYDERDCEDAYRHGTFLVHGRDLSVEFARGSRKTPLEMRGKGNYYNRYSSPRRQRYYPSPDRSYQQRRDSRSPSRSDHYRRRNSNDDEEKRQSTKTRSKTRHRSRSRSFSLSPERKRRSAATYHHSPPPSDRLVESKEQTITSSHDNNSNYSLAGESSAAADKSS
ncbi:7343_t:CDS:2 [Ambispora gerdemannii]|uniref:7343_t:CDS:1 n=1 Tax=Ambispora gerdemannii TaxID=144530 RepID=A0A9N8VS93_9GLOM|nr:7343_t:CDS:2 [Ambispora gerdemannii]